MRFVLMIALVLCCMSVEVEAGRRGGQRGMCNPCQTRQFRQPRFRQPQFRQVRQPQCRQFRQVRQQRHVRHVRHVRHTVTTRTTSTVSVHESARIQAMNRRTGHIGSPPPGQFEGVGFSTRSAADALRNVCYYGQKRMIAKACHPSGSGWHCTARFVN